MFHFDLRRGIFSLILKHLLFLHPWHKLTLAATGSHLCKRTVTIVALTANHPWPAMALAHFLFTGTGGRANGVAVTGKASVTPFGTVMELLRGKKGEGQGRWLETQEEEQWE